MMGNAESRQIIYQVAATLQRGSDFDTVLADEDVHPHSIDSDVQKLIHF